MSRVFVRKAVYDYRILRPIVFDLLSIFDPGIGKKDRILVKPNLLAPAPPERAVTTHPLIVRAVAEYLLEKGARPQISDSPGMGTFERIMKEGGYIEALAGLPVELKPFGESVLVNIGPPYNEIEISADTINADAVINLPKLKAHTQMLLTLGVKNMFGCIVGMRKPEWHLRAGIERDNFAELLVRIYAVTKPEITLLDGILSLEGQGPGKGGKPRELGILMASDNAVALDAAVCRAVNIEPDDLFTNRAARRIGLGIDDILIDGELPSVKDMNLPEIAPLVFGPRVFHGFVRRNLVQRPVCDSRLCRHCGECWRYCPAKAISPEMKGLSFDYDRCIRCYCCIEVCPYGALSASETGIGKVVRKVVKRGMKKGNLPESY